MEEFIKNKSVRMVAKAWLAWAVLGSPSLPPTFYFPLLYNNLESFSEQ